MDTLDKEHRSRTDALPRGEKRHLDEVARRLLSPLLAAPHSRRSGWRLAGWDAEQGVSLFLEGHGRVLLMEFDRRDDGRPCHARTAHFNVTVRRHFEAGAPLDRMDRAIADRLVAMIRRRERALELSERPTTARRTMVRCIEVDRVLVPEGNRHYYVNPYVGCTIGCPFCWAAERADLSRHLEGLPRMEWGRWVDVKVNAADVLRDELSRHPPGPVRFSPVVTDPYQPLERRHRVTRRCLEVMEGTGFTPVILTRAARVLEDKELFARMPGAAVGLSIPTDDDRVRSRFEPGADPIEERIDALERLRSAGARTFAVVQPVLPMNPSALAARLAPVVDFVRVDGMQDFEGIFSLFDEAGVARAGREELLDSTRRELVDELRVRGTELDELDDLGRLVTGGPQDMS